jgi:ubiquinone/menaquinone biosynthesis C-methylase UbiE
MAFLLARFSGRHEWHVADRKRTLLADLDGDILEIGPGAGVNLRYYRSSIRWVGIEPNPFMHPYLRREAKRVGLKVEIRSGAAERLNAGDESVDAVVSTLVLCSVQDVRGTLREIQRVLRPGGRFVFLEHVAAPPKTWLRRLQRMARPVSRVLADGCCPDRETWRPLVGAGFARVEYQSFRLPIPITAPHIAGVAIKRASHAPLTADACDPRT